MAESRTTRPASAWMAHPAESAPLDHLEQPHPGGRPIAPGEKRWVAWFALAVLLLTTLPYLAGYAVQGDEWRFSGFIFAVEDGNSYLAKMAAGSAGAWLFRTPYTAMPQTGVLMFLPYLLLGKLAAPPGLHEQLVFLYHLFRILAGWWMIQATYAFIAWFIDSIRYRRLALVLAILGGGLGWISLLAGPFFPGEHLPLEFYSPETFGFLAIMGIPHLALSRACMLAALLAYLQILGCKPGSAQMRRQTLALALYWLGALLAQPLSAVIIGFVMLAHLAAVVLWQMGQRIPLAQGALLIWFRRVPQLFLAGLAPGLLALYQVWALSRDPFLQAWSAQNIIRSPHPGYYLLAYGLLAPYVLVGMRRAWQKDALLHLLPAAWVLLLPLLANFPINLQRRLPDGIWVAGVILAVSALSSAAVAPPGQKPPRRQLLFALPLLLAFPSTLILFFGSLISALRPSAPMFLPGDQAQATLQLGELAFPQAVVLSAYDSGNVLPAWTPLRVVIGHGPESADLQTLAPQVRAFYDLETTDETRRSLLCRQRVDFVFWGPDERRLGDWQPEQASYLRSAGQVGAYSWFRVELPCP